MTFPVNLPPSPVIKLFPRISWDLLDISSSEEALLKSGEQNVLEYSVYYQEDAYAYSQILLKILKNLIEPRGRQRSSDGSVSDLPLDFVLSMEDASQHLDNDFTGVALHYVISRLCDVVVFLDDATISKSSNGKKSKATLMTTFFPSGLLVDDWKPLLQILREDHDDKFVQRGSAFCLSVILVEGCKLQQKGLILQSLNPRLDSFVSWITSRLQSSSRSLITVSSCLVVIVMCQEARDRLAEAGVIGYLARHLSIHEESEAGPSAQQVYELAFCMWIMSYDRDRSDAVKYHFHRDGAVRSLVDLLGGKPREKVIRCSLAALANLATCEQQSDVFLRDMIGCGLMDRIVLMKQNPPSDPDMAKDLDVIDRLLHTMNSELTRWDVYQAELNSRSLQWGVLHTDKFFRENYRRMEGESNNFRPVKQLIELIRDHARDEDVASIACFDLGEFIRLYPNGKVLVKRLGAREAIMPLIEHDNDALQMQAVTCLSKMLVDNWAAVK